MKIRYHGILLIFLLIVAIALSGCSGSNTSGTPTPTAQPGGPTVGTPTPAATQGPTATPGAGTAMTVNDLYGTAFKWIETRTTYAGTPMIATMKVELLGQEMHEGKMMDHTRITTNLGTQDSWSDPNAPHDTNTTVFKESDAVLTRVGPETITVNGRTYACTKYTATIADVTSDNKPVLYTYWSTPDAPAPVQSTTTSDGVTLATTQLTGWG